MTSVGETLRRERLRRSFSIEQISQELKISPRFLEAIEAEKWDKLPGSIFAKSFVRQYGRLLGLDDDELVAEVRQTLEPPPAEPQPEQKPGIAIPSFRVPRLEQWQTVGDTFHSKSLLPAVALVVLVMLACSGVYAWWQHKGHPSPAQDISAKASVPPQPVTQAPPASSPAVQPAPVAAEPAAPAPQPPPTTSQQPQPAAPTPAPAPTGTADSSADRHSGDAPATAPTTQRAAGETSPPAGSPVKVELTAAEPVWVLARGDGKYIFSGTMDANQTRTVEANGSILLRLGNAGGVTITLNGKPIGSVGPKGQVREVQLTSGGFKIAVPKPALLDPL